MKFQGTEHYILSDELALAVNAAVKLEKPLLLKGEPGTGTDHSGRQLSTL